MGTERRSQALPWSDRDQGATYNYENRRLGKQLSIFLMERILKTRGHKFSKVCFKVLFYIPHAEWLISRTCCQIQWFEVYLNRQYNKQGIKGCILNTSKQDQCIWAKMSAWSQWADGPISVQHESHYYWFPLQRTNLLIPFRMYKPHSLSQYQLHSNYNI